MNKNAMMSTALGAAFAAAMCVSSPALALEGGQCGSKAEIVQALHDEGQVQVVTGQRAAVGSPNNIFTTNKDLSLGYNIESGIGNETGTVCVRAKYTDLRFNTNIAGPRPVWASFGPATPHDQYLNDVEIRLHDRVVMGATTLVRNASGQEVRGPFLMLIRGDAEAGSRFSSGGAATATNSRGGITTLLNMANVETTDNFSTLSRARVQTASVDSMPRLSR